MRQGFVARDVKRSLNPLTQRRLRVTKNVERAEHQSASRSTYVVMQAPPLWNTDDPCLGESGAAAQVMTVEVPRLSVEGGNRPAALSYR